MDSNVAPSVPELVTLAQANAAVAVLVVLGLLAAPVAALLARRKGGGDPVLTALLVGGPPVLVGLLWLAYNALTNRLGLDRIVNLAANFVLFITVGVLCGAGWAWLVARRQPVNDFSRENEVPHQAKP